MQLLNLPSPAKLNLCLHILGRRDDGYHELQTAFQLLDYGDTLSFSRTSDNHIELDCDMVCLRKEDNLVYKAAIALQKHLPSDSQWGVKIKLSKILPSGGGIGGGSSNAATTLLALNHLWELSLNLEQLGNIGIKLGADVPIFVHGHSAWAEGVGERLQNIKLPEKWFVVVKPDCHVSTPLIFSHKELTRDTSPITVAAFLDRGGKNDCQNVVEKLFPQVRNAVTWLDQFAPAQLTGTGACIFASFADKRSAEYVLAQVPDQLSGFVAKGVNMSPLHHSLP